MQKVLSLKLLWLFKICEIFYPKIVWLCSTIYDYMHGQKFYCFISSLSTQSYANGSCIYYIYDCFILILYSDGCGRSGTFISIYYTIERLKVEGLVDIFQAIKNCLLNRGGLVANSVSNIIM